MQIWLGVMVDVLQSKTWVGPTEVMSNADMMRGIDSGFIRRYGQEIMSNTDMLRSIDSGFIRRYGQTCRGAHHDTLRHIRTHQGTLSKDTVRTR